MTEQNISRPYAGPADRVHWGLIIAGMFTALSLLVLSSVLAFAVGFAPTYSANVSTGYRTGAIIWGAVAAFIAFGIGGYLAARWASMRRYGNGLLHGFLVWAVGVPVLVYGLQTQIGPQLGMTRTETGVIHATEMPAQTTTGMENANAPQGGMTEAHARAWWMLLSLCAGFIGAVAFAAVGAGAGPAGEYERTTRP